MNSMEQQFDNLRRIGGDEFVREMVELFLTATPSYLAAALRAGRTGDWPQLQDAAHSLKANAGYLGAEELRQVAEQLEALARTHQAAELPPLLEQLAATYARARAELQARLNS